MSGALNILNASGNASTVRGGASTSLLAVSRPRPAMRRLSYALTRSTAGVRVIQHPQGEYPGLTSAGASSRHQRGLAAVQVVPSKATLEAGMTPLPSIINRICAEA